MQTHLKQLVWIMNHARDWHHPNLPGQRIGWGQAMNIGHLKHLLRASWRCCCFESWQNKNRRDAAAGPEQQSRAMQRVSALHISGGTLVVAMGVLMGSVVRPARMQVSRIGGAITSCPFCRDAQVPDWAQSAWACDAFSSTRPARPPADAMQAVLAWPCA